MRLISSDTSVWIDFSTIDCLEIPFRLAERYSFIMSGDAMDAELLSSDISAERLTSLGIIRVALDETEFVLTLAFGKKYKQLSFYDCVAMAIAKTRDMILLTSDGPLRKAATTEGIEVHGTIWLVDELRKHEKISMQEYMTILNDLLSNCGKSIRLPVNELKKRLEEGGL